MDSQANTEEGSPVTITQTAPPLALHRHLPRRLTQLYGGLTLYALSMVFFVRAQLGVMPWDVLHQGLARHLGGTIGLWAIAVGVMVLLLWIPIRQRPGLGTISNVLVIGLAFDAALMVTPMAPESLVVRIGLAVAGLVLNAVATAMYVGAQFGPGPRDGLMTGLSRRAGGHIGLIRTAIEVTVVASGWILGGSLGFATALYAIGIGPLVQILLPRLTVRLP